MCVRPEDYYPWVVTPYVARRLSELGEPMLDNDFGTGVGLHLHRPGDLHRRRHPAAAGRWRRSLARWRNAAAHRILVGVRIDAGHQQEVQPMIKTKLTLNGGPFNAARFADQLKKDVLEKARAQVRTNIEAKLSAIRCPDHAVAGQVNVELSDFSGGRISVKPCCDKVADQVRALLKSNGDATPSDDL
jgi:hypothetical protein